VIKNIGHYLQLIIVSYFLFGLIMLFLDYLRMSDITSLMQHEIGGLILYIIIFIALHFVKLKYIGLTRLKRFKIIFS